MASAAHGLVTHQQMVAAGVTLGEIRWRLQTGALLREHRGVYRVGHRAPSVEARYLAAVLACGGEAVLSGRAAAYLWGLLRGSAPPAEVTAPTQRRVKGVRTRRVQQAMRESTVWRGIPITTIARTLVDLAAAVDETELARACHEAGVRHHTTPRDVEGVLARCPSAKGAATLRAVLSGEVRVTLSELERRFLRRLRNAELPLPQTNRLAGSKRVDCRWTGLKLTVELDSYRFHNSRHAWEQDHRREREARARGDEFRRYTYGDVFEHPRLMMAELGALLEPRRPA